jgi:membrane protease YdiL (CAAX protease family)
MEVERTLDKDVSTSTADAEQHSLGRSVILHLLPGVLILVFFVAVTPVLTARGFPTLFCLFLAVAAVLIPFELGYLLYQAKRTNGSLSLNRTVLYRQRMPVWQYFVFIIPLAAWAGISYFVIAPAAQESLRNSYFAWLPEWFFLNYNLGECSRPVLLATCIMGFVFNGIAGPVVEELYFRGYLLPRISRLKYWAPPLHVLLFSVYHFFSPWRNLERILALLPGAYVILWKKNIYMGMIPHCLLNSTGMLLMTYALFK